MKIGRQLKLEVYGESHAPKIGMRLEGFPAGVKVDSAQLQAFLERRAPGRNALSTTRHEADIPEFTAGLLADITTGGVIEAIIRNTDTRSGDYEKTIPRPGHADFPNYVKWGRIPAGGGANSGRMTAMMCVAGGICLQELARRGICVKAWLEKSGDIEAARQEGDSVGGVVACEVTGLPIGLGGAMFEGLDGALAQALFGIPGVKGIEFGNGFQCTQLKGSENNDAFAIQNGKVVTCTNRHGGILGGMSSGMPLTFKLALKPTPSIFKPQSSVDLATMQETILRVRGRHDPCIAIRAIPVVEALTGFTLLDAILVEETCVTYGPVAAADFQNVVIDSNVAALYPAWAQRAIYVIQAGEEHKTLETISQLWSAFARAGLGRKDYVTAVGGGVTGDLTGFAAATWMRGIDWVNIPTTLLAMVDASYGGKTACDLPEGKNLAGAFHPPRRVIIDTEFLKTLPKNRLAEGRAEMIKHEVIAGLPHMGDVSQVPSLAELKRNLHVKISIVQQDPLEKTGARMKLNCGHTIAHALEKYTHYALSHGEAVAIGCVEEARLAVRLGLAKMEFVAALAARFAAAQLPTAFPAGITFDALKPLMKGDKKREGDAVTFALPCDWGDVRAVKLS